LPPRDSSRSSATSKELMMMIVFPNVVRDKRSPAHEEEMIQKTLEKDERLSHPTFHPSGRRTATPSV
jgi:hypothetical protein